jgi:hypothetical protein
MDRGRSSQSSEIVATWPGPSRRITVEPIEVPNPSPAPAEPVAPPAPAERPEPEPVPAL